MGRGLEGQWGQGNAALQEKRETCCREITNRIYEERTEFVESNAEEESSHKLLNHKCPLSSRKRS